MDKEEIIKKWLNDDLTEDEQRHFEHSAEFRSVRRLSTALNAFRAPEYDVQRERARLRLDRAGAVRRLTTGWVKPFMQMAAVFLVMLGLYYFFVREPATQIRTTAAEHKELILPDGSLISLNAQSSLTYNEKRWDQNRALSLEGEAHFSVSHGSAFVVRTESGSVRVLGTKFNVKQREGLFEVDCYEGRVSVEYGNEIHELAAFHGLAVIDGDLTLRAQHRSDEPAWLSGKSEFRSVPYLEVVRELERQYNVTVQLRNIDPDKRFTGSFPHSDLSLALRTITKPLGTKFTIHEKQKSITIGE